MKGTTASVASSLSKLAARPPGLGNRGLSGLNGAFTRYLDYGSNPLPWLHGALGDATTLADIAGDVADSDMELGLLRMTGPRLQAAMFGAMLLSTWFDFLQLADVVLRKCPAYSVEKLWMDMDRVQRLIEPTLAALASGEPEQVEAATTAMPELMGQLTREFASIRDGARTAMERNNQVMAAAQFVEMLTMLSTMKMSLPAGRARRAGRGARGERHARDRQSRGRHGRAAAAPRTAARGTRVVREARLHRCHGHRPVLRRVGGGAPPSDPWRGQLAHGSEPMRGGAMLHVCRRSLRNGMGQDGTIRDAAG